MTEQEIFDRVWNFLNLQGKPSYDIDKGCMYRSPKGLACAVGCLLDDVTAKKFDTFVDPSIFGIAQTHRYEIPKELVKHIDFLEELQSAHDSDAMSTNTWLESWRKLMSIIAKDRGLDIP